MPERGKVASIKSTLHSMQTQAEITHLETGSYASLFNTSTFDCVGSLSDMAKSLTDQGVTIKCYSRDDLSRGDVYRRFGATAIIYDIDTFKAWSTDQNGVVTWDQKGVDLSGNYVNLDTKLGLKFTESNNACALAGGKLPSIEQLFTLGRAYHTASGNVSYKPTSLGFVQESYWSSTSVPYNYLEAYGVNFNHGYIYGGTKAAYNFIRCVR